MSSKKEREILSQNLKHLVSKSGKSRNSICDDTGFTTAALSTWIKGKRYPRAENIKTLADYFGVEISDLTEEHGQPKKERIPPDSPRGVLIKAIEELSETEVAGFLAMMNLFRGKK